MNKASAYWTRFSDGLLNALYPAKCSLCGEFGPALCELCRDQMVPNDLDYEPAGLLSRNLPLFRYSGQAAEAVQRLKYERSTALAEAMSDIMLRLGEGAGCFEDCVIVPVPIHWSRSYMRGFNQAEALCMRLPEPHMPGLLKRVKATLPQAGLQAADRRAALEDAFSASKAANGMRILLVDDVITTGQTVQACAKALLDAGALEVSALAFAGNP